MTDKVLQHLLHLRQNVFISGLGRFSLETVPAELQPGSSQIQAPAFLPEFQSRPLKNQSSLAEDLKEVYGISGEQAAGMEAAFSAAIQKSLDENRRYDFPGIGVLLAGFDGSLQFVPEKSRIQSSSHFGLRPVSAKQLLVRHQFPVEKEAPVIPLQPFEKQGKAGKRPFRLLAYAASGVGIALAAGTLIWLNSITPPQGQQAGMLPVPKPEKQELASVPHSGQKKVAAAAPIPQKAAVETPASEEIEKLPVVYQESAKEEVLLPASKESSLKEPEQAEKISGEHSGHHSAHRSRRHRESVPEIREKEKNVQENTQLADADSLRYHVVAGSFKLTKSAKIAERIWKKAGYRTSRHFMAEKEMIRVSVASFASKEEAEIFRDGHRADFTSALWILDGQ